MNQSNKITIYSAEKRGQSIFRIFKEMISELPEAHELGQRLFKRNIKALYRQSLLGFFWALIPPLVTAGVWILLRSNNVANFGETNVPYPVFIITGTLLWQIFSESITTPLTSVNTNKSILVKINIPREGLLLSGIYTLIFNLSIKTAILVIIYFYFEQALTWSVLMVPVGIIAIVICGFSLGLLIVPIGMLYTDIGRGVTLILPFLMYLTPVIYPMKTEGLFGLFMKANPMASLLTETRNWLTSKPIYDLNMFIYYTGFFFLILIVGLVIYRISMPMIIERIGS
ncbi:MAG: ABC transporter permease [Cyclobacteriaceae bacterium]